MQRLSSRLRMPLLLALLAIFSASCAVDTSNVESSIVAAAAADPTVPAPPFEATQEYLQRARIRTDAATTYRFEGYTEMTSSLFNMGSRNEPFMTGEVSGEQSSARVELGPLMGPMLSQAGLGISDSDLAMNIVADGNTAYINTPLFSTLFALDPSLDSGDTSWANGLATGWGRVEFDGDNVLGELNLGASAGGAELLAVLDSVGEVLDGGTADVRGVETNVAHANVTFSALFESTGQDLSDLGFGRSERDMLDNSSANIAIYVDADGFVRRIEFTMDFSTLEEMDPTMAGLNIAMWQRVDFYDFGETVRITIPSESYDITDEFKDFG